MASGGVPKTRTASRAVLVYNVLRLALFGACFGIGWLAGLRGVILICAALLVSGLLSWFALRRQRIAMGLAVERTVERSRVKMAARTSAEDELVDQLFAASTMTETQATRTAGDGQTSP